MSANAAAQAGTAGSPQAGAGHLTGYGSSAYRNYVLISLTLIYVLNFLDRGLLAVVAEEVMHDLQISDSQFGLLTGFGFAVFYTLLGIPIAHMAESRHRVWIMAVCVAIWSAATALSGLANPILIGPVALSGFVVMLICRLMVGMGEAGCTPPANSLIADYFPPGKRAQALGVYGMGVTLGGVSANLVGGPLAEAIGWRNAFMIMGALGIVIAIIFKMSVREPPRGYTDPPGTVRPAKANFGAAMKELASKPSFWLMTCGATMASFAGYGITTFQTSLVRRTWTDLTLTDVTVFFNAPAALAASLSVFMTGWLVTRISGRFPSAIAWLPGVGILLSLPFAATAYMATDRWIYLACIMIAATLKYGYITAQYTIGQGVVGPLTRATAIAILLFVVNLIGYGFGPLFIGFVSDQLFGMKMAADGFAEIARSQCRGEALQALEPAIQTACRTHDAASLRESLLAMVAIQIIPAVFFLLCARVLQKDMVAKPA